MSPPKPVPDWSIGRETVACRLTASGRSAVAVIAVGGPAAGEVIARFATLATGRPAAAGQVRYGRWHGGQADDAAGESIVICPLVGDAFELHCHGGPAAVTRILDDLRGGGVRVVSEHTWLHRAGRWLPDVGETGGVAGETGRAAGETSPLIGEADAVLSRCVTPRTAAVAADQCRGAMLRWAESVAARISAHGSIELLRREAAAVLERAAFGTRLAEPFRVVLAGPPNVGKSSLINAIVGFQRSITHHHAGTTRDVLHADAVLEGVPIRLTDTAGIRDSDEAIEREGVSRARRMLREADLVVWVRSPDSRSGGFEWRPGEIDWGVRDSDAKGGPALLNVLNKCDLLVPSRDDSVAGLSPDLSPGSGDVPRQDDGEFAVSAVTGAGIEEMQRAIVAALVPTTPNPGDPVPLTDRQVVWIRRLAEASSSAAGLNAVRGLIGIGGTARRTPRGVDS